MTRVGVIPAAGQGSRWGGFYKELLPCGDGEWLIDRALCVVKNGGADAALIVTSQDKLATLSRHLSDPELPVFFTIQRGDNDIWSAIEESFAFRADRYLFVMPDTYVPVDAFRREYFGPFGMATFRTNKPDRFGVLHNGAVVNKRQLQPGWYDAWGLLTWTRDVVKFWQRTPPVHYTDAINMAIGQFDNDRWHIGYYADMATWDDYRSFVCQ